MRSLLYLVNFYGTPPLNFLKRYLEESGRFSVTAIKLPAVRLVKGRLFMDALLIDHLGREYKKEINIPFPFPYAFTALAVYVLNIYFLFYFLKLSPIKVFDLCVGDANFNGFFAYVLRKLGKCRYSVFMDGDVLPDYRIGNISYFTLTSGKNPGLFLKLGEIFLIETQWFLRRLSYGCDMIWYPTDRIKEWDSQRGLIHRNTVTTSCGVVDSLQVRQNVTRLKDKRKLCYIGQLTNLAGIDLVLESLAILKKYIADVHLIIIGGGSLSIGKYKVLAERLGISEQVSFLGYIPETNDAINIMSECSLGLALFKPVINNVSLYTEPSKVKEYIKAGIPVVMTNIGPDVRFEILRFDCGILVEFDKNEVARALTEILSNEEKYERLLRGVPKFAEFFDYRERFAQLCDRFDDELNKLPEIRKNMQL